MLFKKKSSALHWLSKLFLGVCLILLYFFNLFSYLEYKLQDKVYQSPGVIDPRIFVVGINEQALAELGPFQQWSRQRVAQAIQILNSNPDARPAVIAVDILYTGESDTPQADAALVEAVEQSGNVVLASLAVFGQDMNLQTQVKEIERPFPQLAAQSVYGLANGTMDPTDGVVRNALLQVRFEGEQQRSFPYEIYRKYTGRDSIPALENDSQLFIAYSGNPGDFNRGPSFMDIFDPDFDPSFFADSIVLIGPYASAMMDAYYTPINPRTQMYGVEIHANVVQMMLEENFKRRVSPAVDFILFALVLLIALALTFLLDVRALLFAFLGLGAAFFALALFLYQRGHIIQLLYPLLCLVILYVYETVLEYLLEAAEKRKVKNTFKKYVDPSLAERLLQMGDIQSNQIGAQRDIAVLFVDIRGFTPMSEALKDQPELVVKILNEYLQHTSDCIFRNGGSVDKFIGDATMALFNGFAPLDDYEFKAVQTALDIVRGSEELNASLHQKYNVDIGFGVGIQCGEAIVGNLGPSFRKDYTAVGDTVNTAARLEGQAQKSQILISQEVYDRLQGRIQAHFEGDMQLKGKAAPIPVYSVTGLL